MSVSATTPDKVAPRALSPWLTFLFAASCGFVAANLYYGQPLAGPISANLGFSPAATGPRSKCCAALLPKRSSSC